MKALILGSTGYTGMMLLRILSDHPHVDSIIPASRSAAGKPVREIDPGLGPSVEARLSETDGRFVDPSGLDFGKADVIFAALPHKAAAEIIGPLVGRVPVIDLSADFRLRDPETYEKWYTTHPHPELLGTAVYGLSEWYREEIRSADLVACPGCYPTCTLLPLLPFAGKIRGTIVANALTGISGGGRKEARHLLFNERSETMLPYGPGRNHRHAPEIQQELDRGGVETELLFTPHLVPVKQGMLVTTVAQLDEPMTRDGAQELIRAAYESSPFVGLSARELPDTRDVRNTNRCDIAVRVFDRQLMLFSAIDNLYKGASGQAVQNMNLRLGFEETAGLRMHGEF